MWYRIRTPYASIGTEEPIVQFKRNYAKPPICEFNLVSDFMVC